MRVLHIVFFFCFFFQFSRFAYGFILLLYMAISSTFAVCFISLLFSLFVYFLLLLLLLLAEGGVKVGRDMHSQLERHSVPAAATTSHQRAEGNSSCSFISDFIFICISWTLNAIATWSPISTWRHVPLAREILDRVAAGGNARFCLTLQSLNEIRLAAKWSTFFVTPMCMLHVARHPKQTQSDGYQQIDPHAAKQTGAIHFESFYMPTIQRSQQEAAGQWNLWSALSDWRLEGNESYVEQRVQHRSMYITRQFLPSLNTHQ